MHSPHLSSWLSNINFVLPAIVDATIEAADAEDADRPSLESILKVCTLFRNRGLLQFLQTGQTAPLYVGLMQSAAVYAAFLAQTPEDEKVTSKTEPFFDAIVGGHWETAREIARHSRRRHHPDYEHEDDFLFVEVLMQAFVFEATSEVVDALMQRYAEVLDGEYDPRLELCTALRERDGASFDEHFQALLQERKDWLDAKIARGGLHEEQYAPIYPVNIRGVALLKLADRLGLVTGSDYLHVPEVLRAEGPYRFNPGAWRRIDFRPERRPDA